MRSNVIVEAILVQVLRINFLVIEVILVDVFNIKVLIDEDLKVNFILFLAI